MEHPLTILNTEIGLDHNEMVLDYLANNTVEPGQSLTEKVDRIQSFLFSKYGHNVAPMLNIWIHENGDVVISPTEFLEISRSTISTYFYNQLAQVLLETQNIELDAQKEIVLEYIAQVPEDENLTEEEKNVFLNMLWVFEAATALWTIQQNSENPTSEAIIWWKVATCDFIGGIAGGIMGGPLGCLVGIVASSLINYVGQV